ncbi:MAG: hypothetical protein IJP82_00565 [Bacteroidaceae bacterium]|nr:hypothetical protein [Bacteroidaceae bacterium]
MKKLFTLVLLVAICLTAQGQQPNEQLRQLEDYFRQQGYRIRHTQSNFQGNEAVRHTFQVMLTENTFVPTFVQVPSEEVRQMVLSKRDSVNAQRMKKLEQATDSIRTAFAMLGKQASESYMYEYHKEGVDTIKYSLAFRQDDDSLLTTRIKNNVYFSNAREVASFDYHQSYDSIHQGDIMLGNYIHWCDEPNGIAYDAMKPFDIAAFEVLIQPVLKPVKKLKGVKTYPVYWRHDKGFDDDIVNGHLSHKTTRHSTYGDNSHTGLTTGTYYFIPAQYETEANTLYEQLDSIAYNYINRHPEQPYEYDFTKRIPVQNPADLLRGISYKDSDEYHLKWTRDDVGFHILFLTTQGELWIPRDWRKLKSYINGKLIYRKDVK